MTRTVTKVRSTQSFYIHRMEPCPSYVACGPVWLHGWAVLAESGLSKTPTTGNGPLWSADHTRHSRLWLVCAYKGTYLSNTPEIRFGISKTDTRTDKPVSSLTESKFWEGIHYAMGRKIKCSFKTGLQISPSLEINHLNSHIFFEKTGFHASNRRSLFSEFELL